MNRTQAVWYKLKTKVQRSSHPPQQPPQQSGPSSVVSSTQKSNEVKFSPCNVKPLLKSLSRPANLADESKRFMKEQKFRYECGSTNYPLLARGQNTSVANAFVATIYEAYCSHYKLELSADDFWTAIAQGVSTHMNRDPEAYRNLFVSHEGKKKLSVDVTDIIYVDLPGNNLKYWPVAIDRMTQEINKDIKADLVSLLTSPFSTTGPVEQTVFDCTLMDSLKNYYSYEFSIECGLPEVTLRGTPNDFQSMIDRLDQLKTFFPDFVWWLDPVRSHLNELKKTAEGNPNLDWWSKICHPVGGGSDISLLSGWMADFVPYVYDKSGYVKARRDYNHYCQGTINGIPYDKLNESITQTEFILNNNGTELKMKLVSGFLGVSQNPETMALRPALGWMTVHLK
jgi:hypothetical protein